MVTMREGTKAAVGVVPKLVMGMTFWMEGEPGPYMDQVQQPAEMAAGMRRRVTLADLKT
ncbi:hypothetical protein SDC9_86733 [bioreactor metagenome]|uniref:Uncharacterized protein n=1 Tax=bioreactor metagenome TaxID=1076179 RepID=A0A644ZGT0_9ZZZZ